MRKWAKEHMIASWVICSVLFAFIIHVFFSWGARDPWIAAKWTAGELLTYVSTVALGLLAVWQNKRFKEENDVAQQRLERISLQANELNVINKIIEQEYARLKFLETAFDAFLQLCSIQNIAILMIETYDDAATRMTRLGKLEHDIDKLFLEISRELRIDPNIKNNTDSKLIKSFFALYSNAKEGIDYYRKNDEPNVDNNNTATVVWDDFLREKEEYLVLLQSKLDRTIFEKMDLEDVRRLYRNRPEMNED